MSIANLLVPNNYHLFAETITVNNQNIPDPIVSATYTPTINIVGMTIEPGSVVPLYGSYYQIGNQVFVNVKFKYKIPNIPNGGPIVEISLPVPRTISGNFTSADQLSGVSVCFDSGHAHFVVGICESEAFFQLAYVSFELGLANGVNNACLNFAYFI